MELPHCSAMWWQHSRSAGVIVAPGRTHAMAGVIAQSRAIVSSANARVLVTLMSVLLSLTTINNGQPANYDDSPSWATTAVTPITHHADVSLGIYVCYMYTIIEMIVPRSRSIPWLLLVFSLPARSASQRVQIWRKLQRYGMLALRSSGHVLPNTAANQERMEWLATAIRT